MFLEESKPFVQNKFAALGLGALEGLGGYGSVLFPNSVTGLFSASVSRGELASQGRNLIRSFDDLVNNISGGSSTSRLTDLKIVGQDDDLLQITGRFDDVDVSIQGLVEVTEDGVLTINGADFAGEVGVRGILSLVHLRNPPA